MELLGIGVVVQLVADAVVGTRLLLLARRTRGLPELCLGACCLLLGGIGLPLSLAAQAGVAPDAAADGLLWAGIGAQNVAAGFLVVATWRVFRADAAWARTLTGLMIFALAVSVPGSADLGSPSYWTGFAARAGAFVWSGVESIRWVALLRRRLRLGLAEPIVLDRFRLWSVCCVAVTLGFAIFGAGKAMGVNPAATPAIVAATSLVGLVAGVSLWLAFAPPAAYLAWRAGGAGLAASVRPSSDADDQSST